MNQKFTLSIRFAAGLMSATLVMAITWLVMWVTIVPAALGWSTIAITSGSMGPTIDTGDIVIAAPPTGEVGTGEVIVFDDPAGGGRLMHRVVTRDPSGDYVTRGDANHRIDSTAVPPTAIIGIAKVLIPGLGLPFLWVTRGQWLHVAALLVALFCILWTSTLTVRSSSARAPGGAASIGHRLRGLACVAAAVLTIAAIGAAAPMLVGASFADGSESGAGSLTADVLSPPTGVSAATGGPAGTIDLTWTATTDTYATGYRVRRSTTPGGPYSQVAEVTPSGATAHQDTGLTPATTYYYVVRSFHQAWESADSNETSATAASAGVLSQSHFAGAGVSEGAWEMIWANPGNITSDDNADASITNFDSDELVRRLRSSNYGFTIPATATIVGIEVEVEVVDDSSGGGADVTDQEARLVDAGTPVGDDKSMPGPWPSTRTVRTYGSDSDLWGTSWTPTQVNSSGFGFGIRSGTSGHGDNSKVDYHRITVYYTDP